MSGRNWFRAGLGIRYLQALQMKEMGGALLGQRSLRRDYGG